MAAMLLMHMGSHPHVHAHEIVALIGMVVAGAIAIWAQRKGRL